MTIPFFKVCLRIAVATGVSESIVTKISSKVKKNYLQVGMKIRRSISQCKINVALCKGLSQDWITLEIVW